MLSQVAWGAGLFGTLGCRALVGKKHRAAHVGRTGNKNVTLSTLLGRAPRGEGPNDFVCVLCKEAPAGGREGKFYKESACWFLCSVVVSKINSKTALVGENSACVRKRRRTCGVQFSKTTGKKERESQKPLCRGKYTPTTSSSGGGRGGGRRVSRRIVARAGKRQI